MRIARWVGTMDNVDVVPAQKCVWCDKPHWLTLADAARYALGAPVSHGLCATASEAMLAGLGHTHDEST